MSRIKSLVGLVRKYRFSFPDDQFGKEILILLTRRPGYYQKAQLATICARSPCSDLIIHGVP